MLDDQTPAPGTGAARRSPVERREDAGFRDRPGSREFAHLREFFSRDDIRLCIAAALILAACLCCTAAFAQARPDAGQTLRELERPLPVQPSAPAPAPSLTAPGEPSATVAPDTTRIGIVKGFKVTGASAIPMEELQAAVEPWLSRFLTLGDLKEAAEAITRLYRERGYPVARAYIPVQTLQDRVVEIAVLEGRIGNVSLKNSTSISDERLKAKALRVEPGAVVEGASVERGLLLLQDTPGIGSVSAALQPGEAVGSTDMVVSVEPAPLISGAADVDNYGNRFTGAHRLGATVNLNNPGGLGDQLSMRAQTSDEKLLYGRLVYRVPVGPDGLVAGASLSSSRYELGRDFEALDANGTARAASVFLNYPFVRSRGFNLSGTLALEGKALEDRIGSIDAVNKKSLRQMTATLSASGPLGNGGGYSAAGQLSIGDLDLKSEEARLTDDATARSHGSFTKVAYSLSGILPVSTSWSVLGLANGQLASKNLDSSEKFSLGGADGVRAYPQGEATGDDGVLITGELRYTVPIAGPGSLQVGGFVDYGAIKLNHNPYLEGENRRHLSAFGLSLNWVIPDNFLIKASLARKLGNETALSDSDQRYRLWVQGVKSF
ncbi:MAG: ShlB/FhaC/HecB family hemolysin secretion/activation protein [Janthinobacterium lividum]